MRYKNVLITSYRLLLKYDYSKPCFALVGESKEGFVNLGYVREENIENLVEKLKLFRKDLSKGPLRASIFKLDLSSFKEIDTEGKTIKVKTSIEALNELIKMMEKEIINRY